jgi:hypothetical protein
VPDFYLFVLHRGDEVSDIYAPVEFTLGVNYNCGPCDILNFPYQVIILQQKFCIYTRKTSKCLSTFSDQFLAKNLKFAAAKTFIFLFFCGDSKFTIQIHCPCQLSNYQTMMTLWLAELVLEISKKGRLLYG